MPPGRPSDLDKNDTREQLADLIVRGMSASEIGEVMGHHKDTVNRWRHDKIVEDLVATKRKARVNRFVSKIDAELEKRLENPAKLTVAELVKIRQALMPKVGQADRPDPEAARRAWREQDERTAVEPQGEILPIPSG